MENIRKPQILIQTDGITNTKIFIDGKELPGVAGVRFSQSYKENKGLPVLQIELKATNVTLDAKMLPALPEPYKGQYISISRLLPYVLGCVSTLYIQNRNVLSKTQEKAFDKVVKIL